MSANTTKKYFQAPKDYLVVLLGLTSFVYLLNFSFGVVEFLPDSLPGVGNIDEVLATYILYQCLTYFNISLPNILTKK